MEEGRQREGKGEGSDKVSDCSREYKTIDYMLL